MDLCWPWRCQSNIQPIAWEEEEAARFPGDEQVPLREKAKKKEIKTSNTTEA